MKRRDWLSLAPASALALVPLGQALAQGARSGFQTQGAAATLRALGLAAPQPSNELDLDLPDIAENGALVRLALSCKQPGVKRFWLLADKNPTALLGVFEWSEWLEPRLVTNIKLAQSSQVFGIAQLADNKLLLTQQEVKVTLGGCAA